jgi:hypothetical protein
MDKEYGETGSWVDQNAAWIDSNILESDSQIFTAGISTPHHGHLIQCHGDTEDEALELCQFVFEKLSKV